MDTKKAGIFAVVAGVMLLAGAAMASGGTGQVRKVTKIDRDKLNDLSKSTSITTRYGRDTINFTDRRVFVVKTIIDAIPSFNYSRNADYMQNLRGFYDTEKLMLVAMVINETMLNPRATDTSDLDNPAKTLFQLSKNEFKRMLNLLGYTEDQVIPPSNDLSDEDLKPYIERQVNMGLEMAIEKGFLSELRNKKNEIKLLALSARWTGCGKGSWTQSTKEASVKKVFDKYGYSATKPPPNNKIPAMVAEITKERGGIPHCVDKLLSRLMTYRNLVDYLTHEVEVEM